MKNTIEGRLHSRAFDTLIIAVFAYILIKQGIAESPPWVVVLLVMISIGFAVSIISHRSRGVIVRYDDDIIETYTKTAHGKQKKARVSWRKVYGIHKLSGKGQVGLLGKNGEVLLSVPAGWKGLNEFTSVVLAKLKAAPNRPEQVDFYLPKVTYGFFYAGVIGVLTMFAGNILLAIVFTPANESVWQAVKFEAISSLLIIGLALIFQTFHLRSIHIRQNELVLRYLLRVKRLHYDDIANVELVEDPNKPVADKARRLRINLKGRSRHYFVSDFPDRIETLFANLNLRLQTVSSARVPGDTTLPR